MSHRWVLVVTGVLVLLLAGCGSDKVTITTPSATSSSSSSAASSSAQTAADTLRTYDPPALVQEAIDHFVETGGLQLDDPDIDTYNDRINHWVEAVCP